MLGFGNGRGGCCLRVVSDECYSCASRSLEGSEGERNC